MAVREYLVVMAGLVDYSQAAAVYEKGRALSLEDLHRWELTVGGFVDPNQATVLDLGAGTGIFTRAWHTWGAPLVVACEPSAAMRQEAARAGWPSRAVMVAGAAERIPLATAAIDVMWLSTVVHHVTDRLAWASETGRVLKRGGWLFIRNEFADLGSTAWLEVLPGATRARQIFPRVAEIADLLARQGLELIDTAEVTESSRDFTAPAVAAWMRQMRHADSLLLSFSDAEIAIGLDRLDHYPSHHRLGPLRVGFCAFRSVGS